MKRALLAATGLGVVAGLTFAALSARVALVEGTVSSVVAPVPDSTGFESEDAPDTPENAPVTPEPEFRRNLQGDEVSDAVAEYLIDREGNVYELHAPYMEIPRLGAPET